MTNIVEIVNTLNKDGYNIDMVISGGQIFVAYKQEMYDVTHMNFADQIRLLAQLLNKEMFGDTKKQNNNSTFTLIF